MIEEFAGKPVRVLVVWEPVLSTDWFSPSTMTLRRVSDPRVAQFWDKGRLISHLLGEHDRKSIVWDHIAIYPAGRLWQERSPQALYAGGPIVKVTAAARSALAQAIASIQ